MVKAVVSALVALLLTAAAGRLTAQAQHRTLFVSAVDKNGDPVSELQTSDVVVREDRVAREILSVGPASDPMQIALLVDNSQAANPVIPEYREGLTAFVRAIGADERAKHQVAIITLADRPTVNTDYTSDVEQLVKGAQRIFSMAGSGQYLLDGIPETLTGFKKREAQRPVIVAVVTAGPDLSDRDYLYVLEPLRASRATLHVIVVGRPIVGPADRAIALSSGTTDTGGRYDNVLAASALSGRLKQLAAELTHQFKVTYARPQSLIPPEKVAVSATRPGLTVRGRPVKDEAEPERR